MIAGNSSDYLNSTYLTRDGGLIAGGYSHSYSSGEKTENNNDTMPSSFSGQFIRIKKGIGIKASRYHKRRKFIHLTTINETKSVTHTYLLFFR